MIYLSEKTGGRLIPTDPMDRYRCLEWMMFQMGGVGPMFGQYDISPTTRWRSCRMRSSATATR